MKAWLTSVGVGTVFLVGAALGAGCGGGDSDVGRGGTTSSAGGSSGTSTSTGAGGGGGSGTGSTGVGGAGTTTTGAGGSATSATTSTSTSATTSSSTGGGACDPAAGDSDCVQCEKMHCCQELIACENDAGNCPCWTSCVQEKTFQECYAMCGDADDVTAALGACIQPMNACGMQCPQGGP